MMNLTDQSPDASQPESGDELAPGVRAGPGGVRIQYSRGGGPGGQNVNKLNTKVEIWVALAAIDGMSPAALTRLRALAGRRLTDAGELHLAGHVHRTQEANRQEVFQRLRELIVQAQVEPKRRRKTRPSAAAKRRRLESKRHHSELKARRSGKI
jgi:ribosome-associated protein